MVDVVTLCELKGVNRFWRALSRRVLCSRLCRGRGQPAPTHLEEITDLDVELLIEAGRPGDTALAGRMLPGLARLHGYGFVVDVAKVRAATLDDEDDEDDDENNDEGQEGSLLRGTAKAALDSCISGDGEAPLKLKIAAVACAGTGVVCGVPVQHMREDTMTELDLREKGLCGPVAMLISYLIPVMGGLTKISLARNNLEEEGTKAICEALEQNETLKELDISGNMYGSNIGGSAGVKHVAKMLGVNGGLTSINLSGNQLCGIWTDREGDQQGTYTAEGITAIADALRVNGGLTSIDLSGNQLCGIWTDGYCKQQGTYTAEGITAIADALRVNGALTALNLSSNCLKDEGVSAVCEAIQSNNKTKLASLNFGDNNIGPVGANAVAAMVAVTGRLTSLDLSNNSLCGVNVYRGTYTAEGITAIADALRVNGALTSVKLWGNMLGDEGWGAIFAAICGNKDSKIVSMDGSSENIGPAGLMLIAKALHSSVTGALTSVDLSENHLTNRGRDMTGITAIADALCVNGALTGCDLRSSKGGSYMGEEGEALIRSSVQGKARFELNL